MVEPERVKVDSYIRGLTDNIKGEVTSSKPADLNEVVRMAHKLMEQKSQARDARILERNKRKWESVQSGNSSGKGNQKDNSHQTLQNSQKQRNTRAMVTTPTDGKLHLCPNMVTGMFLLNNRYAFVLFDLGSDRSFVDTRFSSMLDIDPVKIGASYEVKLADRRVVSTNIVLIGCTLSLVNHVFEIDLMPIELGTFDVIIGMDWLVKHDAVIVCGEKVVRIPYGNKMLIVESDKGVSRLKVISCIKAQDVPVIHDFPEVFPKELLGLPPPRQVEVRIDLVPGAAPVARAPYRLAPFEMKELSLVQSPFLALSLPIETFSSLVTMRPLFFPEEELEAEALELRRASLALTLWYLASKSLICLGSGLFSDEGEVLIEKVIDMKELMFLTNSLLQNDPSCHICGIQFGHLLLHC
ncbi:putative reverse transcriptase domain-containing protein [Tanacetum coccineum]